MTIDSRSLAAWLASCILLIFVIDDPYAHLVVITGAALLAAQTPDPRPFKVMVTLGLVILVIRTVFFSLTGHSGTHILLTVPRLELPLGPASFYVGGDVSAESVIQGTLEGIELIAVVACFGAFSSAASAIDLLRLLPRSMREASLVMNIAVTFVPNLVRTMRDVRDSARMRGSRRARIIGSVVPVIAEAVEKSITLAEAMESRGYGRGSETGPSSEGNLRAFGAVGLFATAVMGLLWLNGGGAMAALGTAASGAISVWALQHLARVSPATIYRKRRLPRPDRLLVLAAIVVAAAGAAAGSTAPGTWSPYNGSLLPPVDLVAVIVATGVLVPAVIGGRQ